jgi:hypothetical protein
MSAKPTSHLELIEPLQSFLESFTQELTEQQFIPAFRDELKRLLSTLENLQESENALQQIARGVDRLREVFAPAGNRLLESVKDLETLMHSNADDLRNRANDILKDLQQTHEQLEGNLRSEAGLLQEQTTASREALSRTVAEIEERLSGLTTRVENLCRKLEEESAVLTAGIAREPSAEYTPAPVTVAAPSNITVELPDDLRELITRSEQSVKQELERYQQEFTAALREGRSDDGDRIAKLDHKIAETLADIGPRVHEELDTAVARLRDQIQTLILAEVETRPAAPAQPVSDSHPSEATSAAVSADIAAALTASETRLMRELSTLRKSQKDDQGGSERVLKELAQGLEDAAERFSARAAEESNAVKESLTTLQRFFTVLKDTQQKDRDQYAVTSANLDSLVKAQREHQHFNEEEFHGIRTRLETQNRALEQKVEEDRQLLTQLSAALARTEQAATSATELALSDSRGQRDKIESGLKDLRERLERGMTAETERSQETLRFIAEAWTEALEALRDFIQKAIASRTDSIGSRLEGLESKILEIGQTRTTGQKELSTEIRKAGSMFEERIEALKTNTESFTGAVENHVKAVSSEVSALRAKQEQSLAVLKEAIRANYDDNAVRLKEVIESAYDNFLKSSASIPQQLERYSHLIESLHQGDQLALKAIASDTQNVLNLSTDKFELILSDSTAMKKFFPLLDKRLEKQSGEMDAARKAQLRQDNDIREIRAAVNGTRERQEEQLEELKADLVKIQSQSDVRFDSVQEDITGLSSSLTSLTDDQMPNFRRDLATLLTSKFEFIENTLQQRQDNVRKEIFDRLDRDKEATKKAITTVTVLAALSVAVQVIFHFVR